MRLEAAHVSFRYGRKGPWILEDLSLAVESGQRLGLFAPSGYGKSTLARLLAGYLAPQKGKSSPGWSSPSQKMASARFS